METSGTFPRKRKNRRIEIEKIGCRLYTLYLGKCQNLKGQRQSEEKTLAETGKSPGKMRNGSRTRRSGNPEIKREISGERDRVRSYDEVEDSFYREFNAELRRNLLGLYEDGALEIFRKEIDAGLQEKKK